MWFLLLLYFRHLRNVGHIGRLIITSEEAIAKGIRRIVAVTGPEAENAFQRANRLEKRVDHLLDRVQKDPGVVKDAKKFKDLLKESNELNSEIDSMLLPAWRKEKIRGTIGTIQKLLNKLDREYRDEIAKKVLQQAIELSQTVNDKYIVHVFEKGANSKVTFL